MEKEVRLIECFNSFQGEGPDSGRGMIILRFKTCNRRCEWCDTSVKLRISMEAPYRLSDIQKTIHETESGILVTGGEPTVDRHYKETLMLLNDLSYPIANLETNGYNLVSLVKDTDPSKPIKFMFSPKIFSETDLEFAVDVTEKLYRDRRVYIKVVYENRRLVKRYLTYLKNEKSDMSWEHRIWLMPEGTTRADIIRNSAEVFDACEQYRFNFSSRDHIIFGFI